MRKPTPDLIGQSSGQIDIMGDILSAGTQSPTVVSWHGKELDYPIDRIQIGKRMRPLGDITTLVESISQIGLLNPINILPDGTLIAGNHRLAAAKALGWTQIRVRVVELSEVDAELAEIDENLRRNNLTVLEESEHLLRREELLEAKGLRAKPGDNQHSTDGGGEMISPPATTAAIAGDLGLSERSAQMRLQIARNLDQEVRESIRTTELANSTTQLVELARQPAEKQRTIADMLMSGQAANVNEAVRLISPPPVAVKKEYWTPAPMPVSQELPAWAKDDAPSVAVRTVNDARLFTFAENSISSSLLGKNKIRTPFSHDNANWVAVGGMYGGQYATFDQMDCVRIHLPGEPIAPGVRINGYEPGAYLPGTEVSCGNATYVLGAQWMKVVRIHPATSTRADAQAIIPPTHAAVWELESIIRENLHQARPQDLRSAAHTGNGHWFYALIKGGLQGRCEWRKSDLVQALHNVAAQMEAGTTQATSSVPHNTNPFGITAHTWEGYEDWDDADEAEYAKLSPTWQLPTSEFNALSELAKITLWRVAARLACERHGNMAGSLQDRARRLRHQQMPRQTQTLEETSTKAGVILSTSQDTTPVLNVVDDILNPVPVSQRDGYDGDEWYTPAHYIESARKVMGSIDLDPASCEMAQTVVKAKRYYSRAEDGLSQSWNAENIWLNCPYSQPQPWIRKLIDQHIMPNRQAVVLVNNATETGWFQALLKAADAVCFPSQRLAFWRHDHAEVGARQGQAFFYFGHFVDDFKAEFGEYGTVLFLEAIE